VRDSALYYIALNHTETNPLMNDNITWTGGRQDSGGLVGSETYIYTGSGWNVTMSYPVVPNPIYTITVTYTNSASQVVVDWQGTCQGGVVTETGYTYNP
jgi:hypothetical protein